jgi:hypothetical protein
VTGPTDSREQIAPRSETVPAIRFAAGEMPTALDAVAAFELVPNDVLVFWEDERTDRYKRVVALLTGNKLKLVKITVGRESGIETICESALVDEPTVLRTQFVTRDTLLWGAEPRAPRGLWKVIVVRIGTVLKMIRVAGDETAPAIEVMHSVDVGA